MADRYIVAHTAVGGLLDRDGGVGIASQGDLVSLDDFKHNGERAWARLVRLGAVRKATDEEIAVAEARQQLNEAQELAVAAFDPVRAQALADQRAAAERVIAEPSAKPFVEPEVAARQGAESAETSMAAAEGREPNREVMVIASSPPEERQRRR